MICNCKPLCKQAIVDWCKTRRTYLDSQFTRPLTDIEFNNALNIENWEAFSDDYNEFHYGVEAPYSTDYDDCYEAWAFDCTPFNAQLRGYVKVDDGKIKDVLVIGE